MAGWHHQCNGHELGPTLGIGEGQGGHRVAKSWTRLADWTTTMDCSSTGFSVHGISPVRILEWIAISSSRGSSWSRNQTQVSCIASRFFTNCGTREAPFCVYYLFVNCQFLLFLTSIPFLFVCLFVFPNQCSLMIRAEIWDQIKCIYPGSNTYR